MKQTDLIGARDQTKLAKLVKNPAQTVIIEAAGLSELNLSLAFLTASLKSKTTWILSPDDSGSIKIEAIRDLLASTGTKNQHRRYFIIYQAEAMTLAAQNALLKTLEEPGARQYFYLLTINSQKLLSTVRSRAQKVKIGRLPKSRVRDFFKQQYPDLSPERARQAEFIASDNFDLWQQLLIDDDLFKQHHQLATWARQLVAANTVFARLQIVHQIGKDRLKAEQVVELILKMYQSLLAKTPDRKILLKIKLWLKALNYLQANGSVRLILTWAVLQ